MSRYTKKLKEDTQTLVWGFDRPMSEYFIQLFDDTETIGDGLVFSISSVFTMVQHPDHPGKTKWGNGELLELIKKDYPNDIPSEHIDALVMDIPF